MNVVGWHSVRLYHGPCAECNRYAEYFIMNWRNNHLGQRQGLDMVAPRRVIYSDYSNSGHVEKCGSLLSLQIRV